MARYVSPERAACGAPEKGGGSLALPGRPPVIILGMHRSGTTMLVGLLREMGFFSGSLLEPNGEPYFFMARNEWLMRCAGGSWDYPLPSRELYLMEGCRRRVASLLRASLGSKEFFQFSGQAADLLRGGRTSRLKGPWGWKDPRNTFTVRLWLDLFPEARVLFIKRHGVDVAQSLYRREREDLLAGRSHLLAKRGVLGKLVNLVRPFEYYGVHSARCATLEGSFDLWSEYNTEGQDFYESYAGPKMDLRYEDLLADPLGNLTRVAAFSGIEVSASALREISAKMDTTRAYAFRGSPALREFNERVKGSPCMVRLGYGSLEHLSEAPAKVLPVSLRPGPRDSYQSPLPNFLVVGASKAGTTTLYSYLRQHPDIYVPLRKELHYFTHRLIMQNVKGKDDWRAAEATCATLKEYRSHFAEATGYRAVGEVSPSYLFYSEVSRDIKDLLGDPRIIIMLRNPVDRAYSNYMHLVRDGREDLGFEEALASEPERKGAGYSDLWLYTEASLYADRVERYIEEFGRQKVHVVFFDDLVGDYVSTMREVFRFLGVEESFEVQPDIYINRSGIPRSTFLSRFINMDNVVKNLFRPLVPDNMAARLKGFMNELNIKFRGEMGEEARRALLERFRPDVLRLQAILGSDLSRWLR